MWILTPTLILSVYSEDPHAQYTIYSGLPQEYQTEGILLVCAMFEIGLECFLDSQYFLGWFTMFAFFHMIQREYEEGMAELR